MDQYRYDSLSRRERECLRLVDKENGTGEIAAQLSLTASSVETYIKSARAKLGGVTRFEAARQLRAYEQDGLAPQSQGSLLPGMAVDYQSHDDRPVDWGESSWQESNSAIDFASERLAPAASPFANDTPPRVPLSPMQRIVVTGLLAIVIAVGLLLVLPLSDSFQRLANLIDVPKH